MSFAQAFDYLAQNAFPQICGTVFPDLMTIREAVIIQGPGGGRIKAADTDVYSDIPVYYEPMSRREVKETINAKMTSLEHYVLTFATHLDGVRTDIDPTKHRLIVQARGNEPEKTFRIVTIRDISGAMFEAVCEKEN